MAFDLDKFTTTSEPLQYDDLDFSLFESQPLDEATLRDLL